MATCLRLFTVFFCASCLCVNGDDGADCSDGNCENFENGNTMLQSGGRRQRKQECTSGYSFEKMYGKDIFTVACPGGYVPDCPSYGCHYKSSGCCTECESGILSKWTRWESTGSYAYCPPGHGGPSKTGECCVASSTEAATDGYGWEMIHAGSYCANRSGYLDEDYGSVKKLGNERFYTCKHVALNDPECAHDPTIIYHTGETYGDAKCRCVKAGRPCLVRESTAPTPNNVFQSSTTCDEQKCTDGGTKKCQDDVEMSDTLCETGFAAHEIVRPGTRRRLEWKCCPEGSNPSSIWTRSPPSRRRRTPPRRRRSRRRYEDDECDEDDYYTGGC